MTTTQHDPESDPPPAEEDTAVASARASDEDPAAEASQLPLDEVADAPPGPGLGKARPLGETEVRVQGALESLVFASDKPVTAAHLAKLVGVSAGDVKRLLGDASQAYEARGVRLVEVAGGYQFRTAPEHGELVQRLIAHKPVRLTRAQLETLSIVAYRQPVTRPEVDDIRGVDTGSALKVLLERGLLKLLGRKDEPGRPLLYGTTPAFLELFGLSSLKDLPTLEEFSELSEESRGLFERRMGEPLGEGEGDVHGDGDEDEDGDGSEGVRGGE